MRWHCSRNRDREVVVRINGGVVIYKGMCSLHAQVNRFSQVAALRTQAIPHTPNLQSSSLSPVLIPTTMPKPANANKQAGAVHGPSPPADASASHTLPASPALGAVKPKVTLTVDDFIHALVSALIAHSAIPSTETPPPAESRSDGHAEPERRSVGLLNLHSKKSTKCRSLRVLAALLIGVLAGGTPRPPDTRSSPRCPLRSRTNRMRIYSSHEGGLVSTDGNS